MLTAVRVAAVQPEDAVAMVETAAMVPVYQEATVEKSPAGAHTVVMVEKETSPLQVNLQQVLQAHLMEEEVQAAILDIVLSVKKTPMAATERAEP